MAKKNAPVDTVAGVSGVSVLQLYGGVDKAQVALLSSILSSGGDLPPMVYCDRVEIPEKFRKSVESQSDFFRKKKKKLSVPVLNLPAGSVIIDGLHRLSAYATAGLTPPSPVWGDWAETDRKNGQSLAKRTPAGKFLAFFRRLGESDLGTQEECKLFCQPPTQGEAQRCHGLLRALRLATQNPTEEMALVVGSISDNGIASKLANTAQAVLSITPLESWKNLYSDSKKAEKQEKKKKEEEAVKFILAEAEEKFNSWLLARGVDLPALRAEYLASSATPATPATV